MCHESNFTILIYLRFHNPTYAPKFAVNVHTKLSLKPKTRTYQKQTLGRQRYVASSKCSVVFVVVQLLMA